MRLIYFAHTMIIAALGILGTAQVLPAADSGGSPVSGVEALARLRAGNQRFQTGQSSTAGLTSKRRAELVGGQSPFAIILSCSDSRVPPELIFDQNLGDLFVVRIAGNTVTHAGLESIDYGVRHLGSRLIMVLGHEGCGAVKGAVSECSSKPHSELPEIFANICPAVDLARRDGGDLESRAIDLNVIEQVKMLRQSPLFKQRIADGTLKVVGARYNLKGGDVKVLEQAEK